MIGVRNIGRYEVVRHLATGGMGQVFLARATGVGGFQREVVVKTLELVGGEAEREARITMFLDEARLLGALHHQFITPVFEVGQDGDDRYFMAMEYVHGETAEAVFEAVVERGLKVPLGFALAVGTAIASALAHAHELCAPDGTPLDVVHRDVSPSNILIGYDGGVRLIDFGIAMANQRATKTRAGTLKGNRAYLSPEQVLRKTLDRRTDIFALGIVLYELTTGQHAFLDRTEFLTLERVAAGEVTPPSAIVQGYPPELERILLKALAHEPGRRYQDAGVLARDLEALAAQRGITLGHAAIADLMAVLFGARQPRRRRIARGSEEVSIVEIVAPVIEVGFDDISDEDPPRLRP
ncbi:MAG: serine/threonine protein kinase [Myxococcales bacterium]|nr:serine/threonine protein kinase [Myxococcales bacterium]